MKKVRIFDVVELKNSNKATILNIIDNGYVAEVVDSKGKTIGMTTITNEEIKVIIYSK